MSALPPLSPQQFFTELFGSRAARNGEIIRRKVRDLERYIGRDFGRDAQAGLSGGRKCRAIRGVLQ